MAIIKQINSMLILLIRTIIEQDMLKVIGILIDHILLQMKEALLMDFLSF